MLKYILTITLTLGMLTTGAKSEDKPELVIYTYDSFASEWGPGP
ncbi:MAG: thiamine ABC transporter substrate-binding protein, partial [Alphaproteobacteria bacterium]|nr:thiamine ABC transporter substrate-binding protein [Alphaproteobacteria bacterium]